MNRVCRYLIGFLAAGGCPVERSLPTEKKHRHTYVSVVGFETKTYGLQKIVHTLDKEPTVIVIKGKIHPRTGHEGPEGE
jgi:hypothetical protein